MAVHAPIPRASVLTAVIVKPGLRRKRAQAVLSILQKGIKPRQTAAFAMSLLCLLHSAKVDKGLAASFLRGKTGTDARLCMERKMRLKLGGKLVVSPAAPEKTQHAKTKGSQFAHGLTLAGRSKEARQNRRRLFPFGSGFLHLPLAGLGKLVKLCFAIIFRNAPSGPDKPLLLESEQSRIEGAVIQLQNIPARLFDAARESVTMQRTKRFQRAQHHERQRPLPHIGLIAHDVFPLLVLPPNMSSIPHTPMAMQEEDSARSL